MANDIRQAADEYSRSGSPSALVVTVPSKTVANAVRYAAGKEIPIFGLNSGFTEAESHECLCSLVQDGSMLFFTAMDERLGGSMAADYFLKEFDVGSMFKTMDNNNSTATSEIEDASGQRKLNDAVYTDALFISPLNETNSAYGSRYEGYRSRLEEVTSNLTASPAIKVEWFEIEYKTDSMLSELTSKFSGCKYQSILVGTGRFANDVTIALQRNNCSQVLVGTFDRSGDIIGLLSRSRIEFAIDQYTYLQGWSPIHFASLYVSTGLVLAPPPTSIYLTGPNLITQGASVGITDTAQACVTDGYPVCPNDLGIDGAKSLCPCTDREKIVIAGVVHGLSTDVFWDTVFDAAAQGARDMGVQLKFERYSPQESDELLYRKMSARILSYCQEGVSGIFVSIPDPMVAEAVAACLTLGTRVMSINAGIDASLELGLLHHIGMVEENAGYAAGLKMAEMATMKIGYCINQFPDLPVLDEVRQLLYLIKFHNSYVASCRFLL